MRITLVSFLSFILSFCCIYLSFHFSFASGNCLKDQQSLLFQLKNGLNFDRENSSKLKLWNQGISCCSWSGVTCDSEGHVTGLDLSGESISGGFDNSSSLFSLQHLQKLNLAANNFSSVIPSGFNKLEKLTYLNLSNAFFEGQIPIEISQLTKLVTLDISSSSYLTVLKLENPNLQKLVQNLTGIKQLYLDGVDMAAQGEEWSNALLPLHDLQEMSMSGCNLSGPLDSSLTKLENLSVIILDENNFLSPVPETFAHFKNLTILSLVECELIGRFPQKIFQIGTLSFVDLSSNANLHGFFPDPLGASLRIIRVSNTNFSGALPCSIGNASYLSELDLRFCNFDGTLPNSLSNLTQLSFLDFSWNNFTGPMPSYSVFEGLRNLVIIDLSQNSISGSIPSSLFTLPSLQEIRLEFNQFSRLDEFKNVSSSVLMVLDLSNNNLSGPLPLSIFQLNSLLEIDFSYNQLNGSLQLDMLPGLKNLTLLDLSYNYLTVNANVKNMSSFPNIRYLYLSSCNMKTFPSFLRNQSTLNLLHLSDNQIHGIVPNWIWKLQYLERLNISDNFLTDLEGPLQNITFQSQLVLDLHNNQLRGPIPFFLENAAYLDYSKNKFSSIIPRDVGNYLRSTQFLFISNNNIVGSIPSSLCHASSLLVLDFSANNISGTIPSCLMTRTKTLKVLNLRKNNLKGPIPNMFPNSCALKTLDLHGNMLHGPIPKFFSRCSMLEVLDIGSNQIVGGFPCFLKNISTLRVIVLRNNKFQGSIGCSNVKKPWHVIQIVDIAFNNFGGKLPTKYFTTWEKMMSDEDHVVSDFIHGHYYPYYQNSLTITMKGQQMELKKILTIFTTIDFSSNHFEGKIPEELMDFKALHILNLSNNALYGEIPSSIGNMRQLESLDLSNNSLGGEIPVQLASLSFLSYLNLSLNHLVGKIPTGTQIQSFQASSFEGNDGLYGPPLTKNPNGKKSGLLPLPQPTCRRLGCSIDWNFISVELGFVFGLGIIIGPLLFWKQWRVRYWKFVDKILCWIFPQLYLEYATHRGQSYTVLRWWR